MNDLEKAKEISMITWSDFEESKKQNLNIGKYICDACLDMSKWKDEQFSKFLLWLDDFYVIRKFDDGEPMTYGELIDAFKNMNE